MKKRVLIIEDDKDLNEAYQMILKSEKYSVMGVFDGDEGLTMTEEFKPHLILLDLRMPNVDGIEFLKRLKKTKMYPKIKVIIFSNLDTEKEINEAFDLGAEKYILKAWASPSELTKVVGEMLAED